MRRVVFCALGLLEVSVALVLVWFAWILPGKAEVDDRAGRIERVASGASKQVRVLEENVRGLRERQPEARRLAQRMREQSALLDSALKNHTVDFASLDRLASAFGDTARGLDGLAEVLDANHVGQLGKGLSAAADFLDKKLARSAEESAARLEKTVDLLKIDTDRFRLLVREAPLDLKPARDIHDGLVRFQQGLDQLKGTARLGNLETMREGFKGLESALSTGAGQVDKLASYYYPVVTFNGLKPKVENRSFWPTGGEIAEGMRQAAKGANAACKELESLSADLPKVQESIDESRKVVERTREALASALKHQALLEPLLKAAPEHAARLAEELPQLGKDLGKVLRDTADLKQTAQALREADEGLNKAVGRWPEVRRNLGQSAEVLRSTQTRLNDALKRKSEYEAATQQTVLLAQTFTSAAPLFAERLDVDLEQQEQALEELREELRQVAEVVPEVASTASRILFTSRLLLLLVAGIFLLHGGYLMATRPA